MRKVYIYKITNRINNKVYIGKTLDYNRRMKEHFSKSTWAREPNKALYIAMEKYGSSAFEHQVIDITNEDSWIEREVYWIKCYNSLGEGGYNMIPGGTEPPTFTGEDHPMAKLNQTSVDKIIQELKEEKTFMTEIALKNNISIDQIRRINLGIAWKDDQIIYPIRKPVLDEESVSEIKVLLKTTRTTHKEIAQLYHVSRTTITAINRGQNYFDKNEHYPIRDKNQDIIDAKKLIMETDIPLVEINLLFNKNASWASTINTGRVARDENLSYPLRKSKY